MRRSLLFVSVCLALATAGSAARAADRIFWAQRTLGADRIAAAQPSGASPLLVADWPAVSNVVAIAVDSKARKIYWINTATGDDAILRSDFDGQNIAILVEWPVVSSPVGIALNLAAGQLFWIEFESGHDRIRRADLDGGNVSTIVSWPDVANPVAITFDPGSDRLYWAEGGFGSERIVRVDTTGASAATLVSWPQISDPTALSVNATNSRVFWIEASFGDDALRSTSIVGGTVETILSWPAIADPTSLVVDSDAGLLYWTESNVAAARIVRATTTGANVTTLLASPIIVDPVSIALEIVDRCISALDCDDLDPCTTNTCDSGTGECSNELIQCPPGLTCAGGQCLPGCSTDTDCNDDILCTIDACSQGTCENTPDNSFCDTGLFCDAQVCDTTAGCITANQCMPQPGNPCPDPATCDDITDTCGGCAAPSVATLGPRYLSVTPSDQGSTTVAILITGDCEVADTACVHQYVQSNCLSGQNDGQSCASDANCPKTCSNGPNTGDLCFSIADCLGGVCEGFCDAGALGDTPVFLTAAQWGTVSVRGDPIRPATSYTAHAVCDFGGSPLQSAGTLSITRVWADTDGDGAVNVRDIVTTVDGVKLLFSEQVTFEGANILPCDIGFQLNVTDITATVDAVKGLPFPCAPLCK